MIEEKMKALETGENLKLRINPKNLDALSDFEEDLVAGNNYVEEIKLIADDEIEDDGVIIETDFGGLDATINTQLEKIKNELLLNVQNNESYKNELLQTITEAKTNLNQQNINNQGKVEKQINIQTNTGDIKF
jgi:predicted RND superfamily exporter protein